MPSAFEYFLFNFSQFILMIFVNMILIEGTAGLAAVARAYVVLILNYVMLFSLSIANSNQIIAGYYVGEGNYEEAKAFTLRNYKYLLVTVIVIVIILNIFWRQIIGLLTDDIRIIEALRGVFLVAMFYEVGRSLNIMFIAALRTVNDIIFPVVMGIISMYGLGVLFGYLLGVHFGLGVLGIMIGQAMDECFRGTFMFFRFKNKDFDLLRRNNIENT
ncbi:MAG: MATE family efflux transporter [bacterium]